MESTSMNATTTENRTPDAAVRELHERELEAVTGGIIIIGGSLAMPFQTALWAQVAAFQRY
jgi:hypothetical protein